MESTSLENVVADIPGMESASDFIETPISPILEITLSVFVSPVNHVSNTLFFFSILYSSLFRVVKKRTILLAADRASFKGPSILLGREFSDSPTELMEVPKSLMRLSMVFCFESPPSQSPIFVECVLTSIVERLSIKSTIFSAALIALLVAFSIPLAGISLRAVPVSFMAVPNFSIRPRIVSSVLSPLNHLPNIVLVPSISTRPSSVSMNAMILSAASVAVVTSEAALFGISLRAVAEVPMASPNFSIRPRICSSFVSPWNHCANMPLAVSTSVRSCNVPMNVTILSAASVAVDVSLSASDGIPLRAVAVEAMASPNFSISPSMLSSFVLPWNHCAIPPFT